MSNPSRRTLLHLVVGAWLAVTISAAALAAGSFGIAASLAVPADTEPAAHAEWRAAVADPEAAARYQAAETNRWAFDLSVRAQLVLAALALVVIAWPRPLRRMALVAASIAALLVAVEAAVVVPWAAESGRLLAMASGPRPPELEEAAAAMRLTHGLFGVMELGKVGLLLLTAWAANRPKGDRATEPPTL